MCTLERFSKRSFSNINYITLQNNLRDLDFQHNLSHNRARQIKVTQDQQKIQVSLKKNKTRNMKNIACSQLLVKTADLVITLSSQTLKPVNLKLGIVIYAFIKDPRTKYFYNDQTWCIKGSEDIKEMVYIKCFSTSNCLP